MKPREMNMAVQRHRGSSSRAEIFFFFRDKSFIINTHTHAYTNIQTHTVYLAEEK